MDSEAEQPSSDHPAIERMKRLSKPWQWLFLLVISALFAGALELAALPAALLIGPMLAAIVAGTNGATVRVPRLLFGAAQAVVGCLVAASISADIFPVFYKEWPLFLGVVIATVAASSLLGWLISRWRILPGTTAVWGSSPGAATAMVLMAGAFGADQRLVAFMQYLRVILVSMTAALVAKMWVDTSGLEVPPVVWFPEIDPQPFAATIGMALVGGLAGRLCRLPSPFFLGSFIFGTVIHLAGGQLRDGRLGDRPELHQADLAPRGTRFAADHRFDRRADRVLRRPCLPHQPARRRRPADRLFGDQPWRHGQRRHHRRRRAERRHLLCHGTAVGALPDRAACRPEHCPAGSQKHQGRMRAATRAPLSLGCKAFGKKVDEDAHLWRQMAIGGP